MRGTVAGLLTSGPPDQPSRPVGAGQRSRNLEKNAGAPCTHQALDQPREQVRHARVQGAQLARDEALHTVQQLAAVLPVSERT